MRQIVVLVAVIAVALGAAYLVLGRGDDASDAAAVPRTDEKSAAEGLVTLRGRLDAAAPAPAAAPEMDADVPPTAEAEHRTVLRGRVHGLDPTREGVAVVRVFPVRSSWVDLTWKSVDGAAAADGTFGLDVTDLMAYPGDLTHLEVRVDHPAYVQGLVRVEVVAARAAGHGELSVEVTLHLGLAVSG